MVWAAGSWVTQMAVDNALFGYDESGAVDMPWIVEGAKPEAGDPEIIDTPSGLERDSSGRLYAIGLYKPASGPNMGKSSSFLLAVWLAASINQAKVGGARYPIAAELDDAQLRRQSMVERRTCLGRDLGPRQMSSSKPTSRASVHSTS